MIQTLSPAIKSSWKFSRCEAWNNWRMNLHFVAFFFGDKLRIIVDIFFSNTLNFGQVASRKLIKGIILFTLTHNF